MKLLIASTNETAAWGASESMWAATAPRLLGNGWEVVVSVMRWPDEAREIRRVEEAGCTVLRRPTDLSNRPQHELPASEVDSSTLDATAPDLVWVNQGDNIEGLGWMEACIEKGIPYFTYSAITNVYRWPDDTLMKRFRRGLQAAVANMFVCRHDLEMTAMQAGADISGNSTVIHYVPKVSHRAECGWPDDKVLRLACVGRLSIQDKGQDILFRVLAQEKWRTRPVEVSLFGEGQHRDVLQALKERLDLPRVRFMGHVQDIESIWRDHHLLVLPSRQEGMATVILEAMLCGRPSVVTDVGGNLELAGPEHAYTAAAASVSSLDDAMERAWADRENWQLKGKRAQNLARRIWPEDPVGDMAAHVDRFYGLRSGRSAAR